jgi:hypothetical protein
MSQKNKIELLGDWGNTPHHATPRDRTVKQSPYLLRECPGCGREVLRYRQRLCDDCRRKRRQKTKRENYYKSKRL